MTTLQHEPSLEIAHSWWRKIALSYVPVHDTPLLSNFSSNLLERFRQAGHLVSDQPSQETEVLLTTAKFNQPVRWREAMIFTARRQYKLEHSPTVFTIVEATPEEIQEKLDYFAVVLQKDPPDPEDFQLPGLGPEAYHTLYEQGRRGGPILSLLRTVQTQSMSIRVVLLVGYDTPQELMYLTWLAHTRGSMLPTRIYSTAISWVGS